MNAKSEALGDLLDDDLELVVHLYDFHVVDLHRDEVGPLNVVGVVTVGAEERRQK